MRKGLLNLANLDLITDVHCRALADVLMIHPILHTVLLDGNPITNQGAARLIACTIKQVEQYGCDWKEIGNAEHPTLVKMETMTYSAAKFDTPEDTLQQAQVRASEALACHPHCVPDLVPVARCSLLVPARSAQ